MEDKKKIVGEVIKTSIKLADCRLRVNALENLMDGNPAHKALMFKIFNEI